MKTNFVYVGIDNGVSGSIGIIRPDSKVYFRETPVKKFLDYPKKEKWIHRINVVLLKAMLLELCNGYDTAKIKVFLERPLVNPMMFNASLSGIRAFEATLIVLEDIGLSYQYMDSKGWQKEMLPKLQSLKLIKKRSERQKRLKLMSLEVGRRLFPGTNTAGDADSLLIAEFARRNNL